MTALLMKNCKLVQRIEVSLKSRNIPSVHNATAGGRFWENQCWQRAHWPWWWRQNQNKMRDETIGRGHLASVRHHVQSFSQVQRQVLDGRTICVTSSKALLQCTSSWTCLTVLKTIVVEPGGCPPWPQRMRNLTM